MAAFVPAGAEIVNARHVIARNAQRDTEQGRRDRELSEHRSALHALMLRVGATHPDTLDALIRARRNDREFLLAALEHEMVSPNLLDTLAASPDLGIALQAVRNPSTQSQTLVRVLRTSGHPTYFYQALAAHPNTPPEILREIHRLRPAPISGLDIWFAGNPSTPTDLLRDLARTSESVDAVRTLLRHPALDCAMIEAVSRGPAVRAHPDDADIAERLTEQRAALCR